ncbi:MAG: FAD-dependent oxidoreductase [Pseudomonadota bacterium]
MLFDLNKDVPSSATDTVFDVCIVGAGAAGITLAVDLSERGHRVALCEAGGEQYSYQSQECYQGDVNGDPYFRLEICRLRFLGGTTNHWGGWCRTFEEIDFNRGYLGDHFRWPISLSDIAPYQKKACEILEIEDDFEFDGSDHTADVKPIKFQFSPPVRFAEKYKTFLTKSDRVSLFLNATMTDLSGQQGQVSAISFKSYSDKTAKIVAKYYIFAMGGIENSRYMRWFASRYGSAFFDSTAPIGKYWMEHPHYLLGQALVEMSAQDGLYYSLTSEAQVQRKILSAGLMLYQLEEERTKEMVRDLLCFAPSIGARMASLFDKKLICGVGFKSAWEQAPEASNEVDLLDEVDRFGVPRVNLKWRKNPIDRETIKQSADAFGQWLIKKELGRVQLFDWIENELDYPENDEIGGSHHMGGTRMFRSSKYGVVDENCRVHGSKNTYVAGSSIFTTGGHNNPTTPIVQFSLRLADHLDSLL